MAPSSMFPRHDPDDDDGDMSFGRQILPVANLPANFDQEPEDGMQYLFTVRRDARNLPHVTRVPNPYETPERLPPPPSDILPAVHPALPSPEWRSSFETHYRNFRKNMVQPTTHVHKVEPFPDIHKREWWWAFLSGRPAAEWEPSKKRRGMRAFADDPEPEEFGSSRSMYDEDDESAPTEPLEETAVYKPREPTPSLLRLIDPRMALRLVMYFTHWTNLHLQSSKSYRITQTHARWIFFLLSRVEDYLSADDTSLLRSLARAYLALLKESSTQSKACRSGDDITPGSCWLIISAVVDIWGQRDLWMEAEEVVRSM
ncbi:hypothetical protein FB45DRAFT_904536 [Roridomyces roridus]|uniref:Uncharacterized protein n=1 Tax=Roridomyces roridus TaxID=1738132 RepID=A0AAD7FU16_9AGAR|nr:hypothetical protein FB45DRAFT_904536 [Roridomyces roridus]